MAERAPAVDLATDHLVRVGSAGAPVPCRGCGQPIVFWRSAMTNRWLPIEVGATVVRPATQDDREAPTLVLRGVNHFVTCPRRDDFRRRRR